LAPNDIWALVSHVANDHSISQRVEHWDGRSWKIVPVPLSRVWSMQAFGPKDVWVLSQLSDRVQFAHWDGSVWELSEAANLAQPQIQDMGGTGPADMWLVGNVQGGVSHGRAHQQPLTLHWDGATWSDIHAPSPANINVLLTGVEA